MGLQKLTAKQLRIIELKNILIRIDYLKKNKFTLLAVEVRRDIDKMLLADKDSDVGVLQAQYDTYMLDYLEAKKWSNSDINANINEYNKLTGYNVKFNVFSGTITW